VGWTQCQVPSVLTERARLAAATQCLVLSVSTEQARSAAATQCQLPSVLTEQARSAAATQCQVRSVYTEQARSADATQCHVACGNTRNEKDLLTLYLEKPRYNAEAILKTYELFINGDVRYSTVSSVKRCYN